MREASGPEGFSPQQFGHRWGSCSPPCGEGREGVKSSGLFPPPLAKRARARSPRRGERKSTNPAWRLAFERPSATGLAADDALDLSHKGAERERIGEMPAHAALLVAKRRDGLDHAGQPRDGLCQTSVAPSPSSVRATFSAFSAILRQRWKDRKRGGREKQKCKCARPNDDRSVPMERTHNQSSPKLVRDDPPAPTINGDDGAVSE
jgi:hypothetical protein